jgi:hypothetical protein
MHGLSGGLHRDQIGRLPVTTRKSLIRRQVERDQDTVMCSQTAQQPEHPTLRRANFEYTSGLLLTDNFCVSSQLIDVLYRTVAIN